MVALIEYADIEKRLKITDGQAANMRTVTVGIPRTYGRRRSRALKCAAEILHGLGIRQICFAEGFDLRNYFLVRGFRIPDTRKLYGIKSAEILLTANKDINSVAIIGGMADEASVEAINNAVFSFRRIFVDVGLETHDICDRLRKKTGAPIIETPEETMLKKADAAIVFRGSGKRRFSGECIVFCADADARTELSGGRIVSETEFSISKSVGELPYGYDVPTVLAAAVSDGKLAPHMIAVKRVVYRP